MAKCYLIGIHGFIGRWLADYLSRSGHDVSGLARTPCADFASKHPRIRVDLGSILDSEKTAAVLRNFRPDYVFHLAAQSSPPESWEKPGITFDVNVRGTLHVLDAVRHCGTSPVVEMFLSSSEYASGQSDQPIREDHPLDPSSPYAVSKIAAGQLAVLYAKRYDLKIVRVRPFFLIGPGKKGDVSSHFCRQIAAVESGRSPVMKVGNLQPVRDFLDIRDGVEALWSAASLGKPGEVYNIASGVPCSIERLLKIYLSHARMKIDVQADPSLFRALDESFKVGDVSKLKALGWKPSRRLEDTAREILEDWRLRVSQETGV